MKKYLLVIAALTFVFLFSCKKDIPESFNISTESIYTFEPCAVTYTVTQTGEASFTQITYYTNDGAVTVNSPTIPFTVSLNIEAGKYVSIAAGGTVTNGTVNINATGSGASSNFEVQNGYVHTH